MNRIIMITCSDRRKPAKSREASSPNEKTTAYNAPTETAAMFTELCMLKAENNRLLMSVETLTAQLHRIEAELEKATVTNEQYAKLKKGVHALYESISK